MPTSKLDLIELFVNTILQAPSTGSISANTKEFRGPHSTYWEGPVHALATKRTTLADMLDDCPNLLLALSKSRNNAKDRITAEAVAQIDAFLANPSVDLDMKELRPRRLLDYVYPIV